MNIQVKNVITLSKMVLLYCSFCLLAIACRSGATQWDVNDTVLPYPQDSSYIDSTKTRFPIENYPQSIEKWLLSDSENVSVPLIDIQTQQRYFSALKSRYFGIGKHDQSPWNPDSITALLNKGAATANRDAQINQYLGDDRVFWGENFRRHSAEWKAAIRENSDTHIEAIYHSSNRGITLRETLLRHLPTADPAYHDPRLAGQGYPFDNLQDSSVRAGTPVYELAESRDGGWKYVLSPSVMGWIRSDDIARVDQAFVLEWVSLAETQLGAFIKESVAVRTKDHYYFTAGPGTVLPFKENKDGLFMVPVPVRNTDSTAQIHWVTLGETEFTAMPWEMTRRNIATLLTSMRGRPYGWGNHHFYNDCSAEIHSLLLSFGILLPRKSIEQIYAVDRRLDLSKESVTTRIQFLKKQGKPFTTLVYIPGHIMLYIGNAMRQGDSVPMTYQNVWGLRPRDGNSRSIIGGAVFLPLLTLYPENPNLISFADKTQFIVGFIE